MFLIVLIYTIILLLDSFTIINAQTCQSGDLYSLSNNNGRSSMVNMWYLNTELSCTCSGQVIQYNVDYTSLTGSDTYNIHFALWDPVGDGNTYELNQQSITYLKFTKSPVVTGITITTPLYTRKGAIIGVYFDGSQISLPAYGQVTGNNLCTIASSAVTNAATVDCSNSGNIISDRFIAAEAVINLIDCFQAPNVANASSTLVDGDTEYGARVRYTCVEGYEMTTGDKNLTCDESAQWSGTVPECTIISCPVITNINNGSVNGDSNHYQSVKSFLCDPGFQLNGTSSVTCQIDGNWNDTIPQCDIVNCGDPGAPPINGTIQSGGQSFVYESVIVYQCSEGFYPSSWPVIQCTANGQWNSTVPTCVAVSGSLSVSSSTASSTDSIMLVTSTTSDSNVMGSSTTTSGVMVTSTTTSSVMMTPSTTSGVMVTSTTTSSVMMTPSTTSGVMVTSTTTSSVMVTSSTTSSVMMTSTTTSSVIVTSTTTSSVMVTSTTSTTDNAMVTSTTSSSVIVNPTTLSTNNVMVTPSTSSTDSAAMTTATTSTTVMTSFTTIIASTSTATSSSMSEAVTFSSTAAKDVVPTTDSSTSSPSQSLVVTMTISETSKDINKQSTSSTDATLSTVIIGGNQGDGNSGSLGIAVGVLAVALVGTIIFILVMIMLILVIRRRKKRAKYNIRRNGDFTSSTSGLINQTYSDMQVTDIKLSNPLYGAGQIEGQIDIYEHITEFDETNSDYCDVEEKAKLERALPPPPTSFESATESVPEIHSMSNGLYMYGRNDSIIKKPVTDDQYFELEESTDPAFIQEPIYWHPESSPLKLYDQLARRKYREISRDKLNITDHLGSGQFGSVEKGLWNSPRGTLEVAIKTLKGVASEEDEIKFLQEAAINGQFYHPNVVQLFGVVTVGQPTLIVLEYIPNGDLKEFLERRRPMPGELSDDSLVYMLIKFSHQVASGMVYLSKKRFIHRDLAARNILVGNDHICKIADFGMSRDLQDESYYRSNSKRIPVKWTAPEAINYRKYSTESDVWSFGAVLYEIWSVGYKPFEQYTNQECLDLVDDGYRLVAPPGCGRSVYKLMIMCWNPNAADRPTFEYLKNELSKTEEIFAETVPLKSNLGGPVHDDKSLYPDLQCRYMNEEDQFDEDNL